MRPFLPPTSLSPLRSWGVGRIYARAVCSKIGAEPSLSKTIARSSYRQDSGRSVPRLPAPVPWQAWPVQTMSCTTVIMADQWRPRRQLNGMYVIAFRAHQQKDAAGPGII